MFFRFETSILTILVIVVQVTPTAIDNISWRTFIIFACFCFAWVSIPLWNLKTFGVFQFMLTTQDSNGIFLLP